MKKIIRQVDEARHIVQVTVADERWYLKPSTDPNSELPVYSPVPSVTWIAGYWPKGIGFYKWLADKGWDEAEAAKQAAGDKGSAVHLAIEMILNGLEFRIDTKVQDKARSSDVEIYERELSYEELVCVQSFLNWKAEIEKEWVVETLASETVVISDIHQCGGTADWICRLTNRTTGVVEMWLIDFKTSKQIWREYELQLSAYRELLTNGENPIKARNSNGTETDDVVDLTGLKAGILQLGYDRNKAGYKFTEIADAFPLFKVAQQIWKREIGEGTPGFTVREFPVVLARAEKIKPVPQSEALFQDAPPVAPEPDVAPKKSKPSKRRKANS